MMIKKTLIFNDFKKIKRFHNCVEVFPSIHLIPARLFF